MPLEAKPAENLRCLLERLLKVVGQNTVGQEAFGIGT